MRLRFWYVVPLVVVTGGLALVPLMFGLLLGPALKDIVERELGGKK